MSRWLRTLIKKTNKIHFSSYHPSFVLIGECILLVALASYGPACLGSIHSFLISKASFIWLIDSLQPRPQDNRKSLHTNTRSSQIVRHTNIFGGKSMLFAPLFLWSSPTFYWRLIESGSKYIGQGQEGIVLNEMVWQSQTIFFSAHFMKTRGPINKIHN